MTRMIFVSYPAEIYLNSDFDSDLKAFLFVRGVEIDGSGMGFGQRDIDGTLPKFENQEFMEKVLREDLMKAFPEITSIEFGDI